MKRNGMILSILSLIFLVCSCGPKVVIPPDWKYGKDEIVVHLKSDPQLNLYQGSPHTLVVCLYHLRDPNAFNQLVDEKDGVPKLLECGRFDPSVTNAKRYIIHPNKELTESLDRPEGAKYVGIVAGYYSLKKEGAVRFFQIPVTEEKKKGNLVQKPGVLKIDLYFSPQQIQ
jgi:type VI secretion system VasD/TssJ family lipoprotein